MIQRQLLNELEAWSSRNNHKPLVLRGARQVGKTTLVDELGKQYDVYIKLNLELSADALVFSISDDVEEICKLLSDEAGADLRKNGYQNYKINFSKLQTNTLIELAEI